MSDLPKAVGRAHRAAIRSHLAGKDKDVEKPGQKSKKKSSKSEKPDPGLKQTDVIAFNNETEPCFVELIKKIIQEDGGSIPVKVAVQEAAYELHISVKTAESYLLKFTARRAPFMVSDGYVSLRNKS